MKINSNVDFVIRQLPQPKMAIVPLKVANGDPALPIIKLNEVVKQGQTIAKSAGFNSVNVFSPVYGKVIGFDSYNLSDHSKTYCVYIENLDTSKCLPTHSAELGQKEETGNSQDKNSAKTEIPVPFAFDHLESNSKALILKRLADCGVIDHNGDSVSDKLAMDYKMLVVPCFDVKSYALENTAILASDYFDNIYNVVKKLVQVFNVTAVFVCLNGDKMTGVDKIFSCGKREQIENDLYKLFVKNTNCNHIYEKYFSTFFNNRNVEKQPRTQQNQQWDKNDTSGNSQNFEDKKDLLDSMLNKKLNVKNNINTEQVINDNECANQGENVKLDKFGKLINRALEVSEYQNLEKMLVLTPVDLLQIYRAIELGVPQTTTFATLGGQAVNFNGVFEICSGCTLEHIQTALGGTHSEQDIEDEKSDTYDAIEDFFDARSKFREEKDEAKKVELKKQMKLKKRIAKKMSLNFVKNSKKKLKTCLGQIAFDDLENGETFGEFRAVFELKNKRVYYLTVKQC